MPIRAMAVCIGLLVAAPAAAQTIQQNPDRDIPPAVAPTAPPGGNGDPRYSFHRVEDGYLRLDVRTGEVSLCGRRQVGWACQALPEERAAFETEIARLQSENGRLKRELLQRGLALPHGMSAPPPAAKSEPPPSGGQVDKVMTLAEAMWYRLVEMIANLQREIMKKS